MRIITTFLIAIFLQLNLYSNDKEAKKSIKNYNRGNYEEAIEGLRIYLENDDNSINFKRVEVGYFLTKSYKAIQNDSLEIKYLTSLLAAINEIKFGYTNVFQPIPSTIQKFEDKSEQIKYLDEIYSESMSRICEIIDSAKYCAKEKYGPLIYSTPKNWMFSQNEGIHYASKRKIRSALKEPTLNFYPKLENSVKNAINLKLESRFFNFDINLDESYSALINSLDKNPSIEVIGEKTVSRDNNKVKIVICTITHEGEKLRAEYGLISNKDILIKTFLTSEIKNAEQYSEIYKNFISEIKLFDE